MNSSIVLKVLSIIVAIIMVVDFFLLFTFRINYLNFWIIAGLCAVFAYWGIPWYKKTHS